MKAMTLTLFMLITMSSLPGCEDDESVTHNVSNFVACWVDRKTDRYALAVDMSFGEYPPEGQIAFVTLDDLKAYLSTHLDGAGRPKPLTILNGSPHGTMHGQCRPLSVAETRQLVRKRKHWELMAK